MKKRSLLILTILTAASVAGATGSVYHRQKLIAPPKLPASLFPEVDAKINSVESVHVTAPGRISFVIQKSKNGWQVPEKGGYPVKFETVKQAVVGMAEMQPIAAKTSREKYFPKLQLGDPRKNGKGTRIELQAGGGKKIATAVLGRVTSTSSDTRTGWQYVRREGDKRAWLAKARIQTWDNVADWLDSTMPTIDRNRIRSARSTPAKGESVFVVHKKPGDRDFVLPVMPQGKELIGVTSPNSLGSALGYLTFADVRPGTEVDFTKAEHITEFETFDGLLIRIRLAKKDGDTWLNFEAVQQSGKRSDKDLTAAEKKHMKTDAVVAKEVKHINKRFGSWAYKMSKYKLKDFQTSMVDITKPVAKAKTK